MLFRWQAFVDAFIHFVWVAELNIVALVLILRAEGPGEVRGTLDTSGRSAHNLCYHARIASAFVLSCVFPSASGGIVCA